MAELKLVVNVVLAPYEHISGNEQETVAELKPVL
jgi:hypothetical protein